MPSKETKDRAATAELKIDQEGFVTPAKAISLPGISLGIWVATLIFYRMLVVMDLCPDYTAFCFFTSLLLSAGGSFLAVSKMKLQLATGSKLFLVLMNTFVIYTSANGIQAGNSFLSNSEPGEVCKKASLIPLLTSASWLPDKDSRETIEAQADSLQELRSRFDQLDREHNELISAAQGSEGIEATLLYKLDSLKQVLMVAEQKSRQWDSLKIIWANATDRSVDSIAYYLRVSHKTFPQSGKIFVSILADSIGGPGYYKALFAQ